MTEQDDESKEGFWDQYESSIRSSAQEDSSNSSNTAKRPSGRRDATNEVEQETGTDQRRDSDTVDSDGIDEVDYDDSEVPIKDRKSVLMYLPDDVWQELDIRFDELNAEYKRQYGESLEKNRDYYPAVLLAGLTDKDLKEILEL